jgi:hypothetical protein
VNCRRQDIAVVCDASGNATVFSDAVTGPIVSVMVTQGTLAATTDITVTSEQKAIPVITITNNTATTVYNPRVAVQDTSGAAALFAAGGTALRDFVYVANERIKFVVAQGGNAGAGTITLITG